MLSVGLSPALRLDPSRPEESGNGCRPDEIHHPTTRAFPRPGDPSATDRRLAIPRVPTDVAARARTWPQGSAVQSFTAEPVRSRAVNC